MKVVITKKSTKRATSFPIFRVRPTPDARERLTETDLEVIERLARENAGEPYRGPLLALVGEVRRLRGVVLGGEPQRGHP